MVGAWAVLVLAAACGVLGSWRCKPGSNDALLTE
jgi:hypothetical protein